MIFSLPRFATIVTLVVLAFAQVAMAIHFWNSFQSDDAEGKRLLVMLGAGLALVEIFMLALADDAARNGQVSQARQWRFIFFCVLGINIAADFGAIDAVTSSDTGLRTQSALIYQQNQAAITRADEEIAQLRLSITDPELRLPSTSLQPLLDERRQRLALYEDSGQVAPTSLQTRIARLESALATAHEIERRTAARADAAAYLADQAGPPPAAHQQFVSIGNLASVVGLSAAPESVRVILAFAMVIVLKLVLNVGFAVVFGNALNENLEERQRQRWFEWPSWPFRAPANMIDGFRRRYWRGGKDLPTVEPPPAEGQGAPAQRPSKRPRRFGNDIHDQFDEFD